MRVLNQVASAAAYPAEGSNAGAQIAPLASGRYLQISVLGNNVYCQFAQGALGQITWQTEFLLITSTTVYEDVQGVRFRDAVSGSHGTITAVLYEEGDVSPINFGPIFSAGIGGINTNVYNNGALVGNEPGIDFTAGVGIARTIADVAGSRVTVQLDNTMLQLAAAAGDVWYATGNDIAAVLPVGGAGALFYVSAGLPAWLAQGARGAILEVGAGGTGWLSIGTRGALLYAGANDPAYLTIGGQGALLYAGANDPTWLAAGAVGALLQGNGAAAPVWIAPSTSGYVLTSNGVGMAPTYQATSAGLTTIDKDGVLVGTRSVLNFITGTGFTNVVTDNGGAGRVDVTVALANGAAGALLYENGANTPAWLSLGAAGTILVGGASVPKYLAAGTAGQKLIAAGGAADPIWTTLGQSQSTPGNPTGTTSNTGVMMGLAGAITPTGTRIEVTISGTMLNGTAGSGTQVQIRYGTGTAPINGAAPAGTAIGGAQKLTNTPSTTFTCPFSCQAIVTGLTANTAYWLDLVVTRLGASSTSSVTDVSITASEV